MLLLLALVGFFCSEQGQAVGLLREMVATQAASSLGGMLTRRVANGLRADIGRVLHQRKPDVKIDRVALEQAAAVNSGTKSTSWFAKSTSWFERFMRRLRLMAWLGIGGFTALNVYEHKPIQDGSKLWEPMRSLFAQPSEQRAEPPLTLFNARTAQQVDFLVTQKKEDVNKADEDGQTPLFKAANPEVVSALIKHGAKITQKDSHGRTVFHTAVNDDVLHALTKAATKAKIEIKKFAVDNYGNSPLHNLSNSENVAALEGHGSINGLGFDVNAKNNNKKTPLHTASNGAVVEALLQVGASFKNKDKKGRTALFEAPDEVAAKALIAAEVNSYWSPNKKVCLETLVVHDGNGLTPFHTIQDPKALNYLVTELKNLSVEPKTIVDNKGRTPLHTARNPAVVKVLLDARFDPEQRDISGRTPLDHAKKKAKINDVIEVLRSARSARSAGSAEN